MADVELTYSAAQSHIFFESEALGRFRLFPKGRRLGATRGAAHAFIEWMLEGKPLLWGDTINGNIDRYVERYFIQALRANDLPYAWDKQKRLLKVGDGYTDFRSADRPENWEGFGYWRVFLNEAGIILDDDYLYTNAVLPMLMDFPDSQLIAAGTPKLLNGTGRLFADLCERARRGEPGYYSRVFTTYDNPWLTTAQIKALAREIPEAERQQEIFGQFVEAGGQRVKREWLRQGAPPASDLTIAIGIDLAISEKTSADYTAAVVLGIARDGRVFLLDARRGRFTFHRILEFVAELAARWEAVAIGVEEVQFQAAVVQELLRTTSLPVRGIKPRGRDKITRFQPLELRYEQGLVIHAADLPRAFEDELLAFPVGEHDDWIDAASIAYEAVTAATGGGIATAGSLTHELA